MKKRKRVQMNIVIQPVQVSDAAFEKMKYIQKDLSGLSQVFTTTHSF
ncbi:hypothetical protein P6P90_12290 [Ectobacillus antri]|jgi:hypothetical protein|uniref:Uncharacterized protein n=1 Tax=Ectobacillus antri TaxID=2486280 RepID=A0ABT6H7C4_9BACI|nr:hypothetical protein [Ectobacillus antri]MDG4657741.1 hypothetical protein [Ectobacillus antri]MDG5754748.1 hypothetical protein [Ectobacillus antri]